MLGLGIGVDISNYIYSGLSNSTTVGLKLWLKNGVGVTTAKWEDSSGNDNHMIQPTAGLRPTLTTDGGLDFEANGPGDSSDHMYLDSNGEDNGTITVTENQGFCLVIVVSRESSDISTILSDGDNEVLGLGITNPPHVSNSGVFKFTADAPNVKATQFHFETGTFGYPAPYKLLLNRTAGTQNKFTLMKNGSALTPDVDNSVLEAQGENPNGFSISKLGSQAGTSNFFDGKILELQFWDRSLTTVEMAEVNSYLQTIHGI